MVSKAKCSVSIYFVAQFTASVVSVHRPIDCWVIEPYFMVLENMSALNKPLHKYRPWNTMHRVSPCCDFHDTMWLFKRCNINTACGIVGREPFLLGTCPGLIAVTHSCKSGSQNIEISMDSLGKCLK